MQTNVLLDVETLELIAQPLRFQLLLIIADGQACVCHFEALLGVRQATISQHLMRLRQAGLVTTQRSGRHVYYRLSNAQLYPALRQLAVALGASEQQLDVWRSAQLPGVACPRLSVD